MGNERQDELYHYGVLGMKWGIRRAARKATSDARSQLRKADRDYTRAINKASGTFIGKKRREAAKRNMEEKGAKYEEAKKTYKDAYTKAKSEAVDKLYSKQSKEANKRVNEMSMGKAFAQSALLGSYGALKYNEARARGTTRGKAAVEAILYNYGNNATLGALSTAKYLDNRFARKKK